MGWCSGTQIFDAMIKYILEHDEIDKGDFIKTLAHELGRMDWDCEGDSRYWKHPLVQRAFRELYPQWFEED